MDTNMTGYLITNGFLHTQKFSEIHLWLMEAAKKHGIDLISKTNGEIAIVPGVLNNTDLNKSNFILYWDKDVGFLII
jgi:hypothetical protein